MTINSNANRRFAETLFDLYPDFLPTQALYIDLEGRQGGSEDLVSLYWPALSGDDRFSYIIRSPSLDIDYAAFEDRLNELGASSPHWIVVYSAGQASPDERLRVIDLFGRDPFPDSEWINLHYVVRKCRDIRQAINEHRNVWYSRDRVQIRKSLEALECEFGIIRPRDIRSHSNQYRDLEGDLGSMEVLSTVRKLITGEAETSEQESLLDYCEADVKNMYQIASVCERMLFSRAERKERRKLN